MNLAKPDNRSKNDHLLFDVAALLNLELPQECQAGIAVNIELMRIHARKVEAFEISETASKATET